MHFARSITTVMYMNLKMWAIGESAFVSIFVNKGPKRCFLFGSAQSSKKYWWWANQSIWLLQKKKKEERRNKDPPKLTNLSKYLDSFDTLIKLFLKMLKFSPKKFFYLFIEEQNFAKENEESIWIFRNIQNFQHEIFKFNWWTWVWSRPCTIWYSAF